MESYKTQIEVETDRLASLRSYRILDTIPEEELDQITQLAAFICNMPISLITLVDSERQWFKSKHGIDASETPRNIAFCHYTILEDTVLEVQDATQDERFSENPLVTGYPFIRFYAGAPLINEEGYSLGSLCVIDQKANALSEEQRKALRVLAKQVVNNFELRYKKNILEELNKDLEATAQDRSTDLQKVNSILRESLDSLYRREQEFKALAENSPDIIARIDTAHKYLYLNPAIEKKGVQKERLLGKTNWECGFAKSACETMEKELTLLFKEKKERTFYLPLEVPHKVEHYQVTLSPEMDQNGEVVSALATFKDISDLKQKAKDLTEVNEELKTLLYKSSHDLKGPVATIKGLSLLGQSIPEEHHAHLFDQIFSTAENLDQVLKKLSILYILNTGSHSSHLISFSDLARRLHKDLEVTSGHHEFDFEYSQEEKIGIFSDEDLLYAILYNILQNSLHFTRTGVKPKVVLKVRKATNGAILLVEDNGEGIDPKVLPFIFDMFYKGNVRSKGSGLGLYIAKKLTKELGGSITCESILGEGTKIKLFIPSD